MSRPWQTPIVPHIKNKIYGGWSSVKKPTLTKYILLRSAGKRKFRIGIATYIILYIFLNYYMLFVCFSSAIPHVSPLILLLSHTFLTFSRQTASHENGHPFTGWPKRFHFYSRSKAISFSSKPSTRSCSRTLPASCPARSISSRWPLCKGIFEASKGCVEHALPLSSRT